MQAQPYSLFKTQFPDSEISKINKIVYKNKSFYYNILLALNQNLGKIHIQLRFMKDVSQQSQEQQRSVQNHLLN